MFNGYDADMENANFLFNNYFNITPGEMDSVFSIQIKS